VQALAESFIDTKRDRVTTAPGRLLTIAESPVAEMDGGERPAIEHKWTDCVKDSRAIPPDGQRSDQREQRN
jgi:hypothetical protein